MTQNGPMVPPLNAGGCSLTRKCLLVLQEVGMFLSWSLNILWTLNTSDKSVKRRPLMLRVMHQKRVVHTHTHAHAHAHRHTSDNPKGQNTSTCPSNTAFLALGTSPSRPSCPAGFEMRCMVHDLLLIELPEHTHTHTHTHYTATCTHTHTTQLHVNTHTHTCSCVVFTTHTVS